MTPLAHGEITGNGVGGDAGAPGGAVPSLKCVLVGDGAVGKTSLVVSYTKNGFPAEYIPTAFDNYAVLVTVDGRKTKLHLCDTAGQDDFDRLRPLCYQDTDVFLLCFSIACPTSYANARDKWVAEVRRYCPHTPIIVVGTQVDLRGDVRVALELHRYGETPVTKADGERLARSIGAVTYVECSALTQVNMKDVFDTAIVAALKYRSEAEVLNGNGLPMLSTEATPPPPPPPRMSLRRHEQLAVHAEAAAPIETSEKKSKKTKHTRLRFLFCCVSGR